MIATTRPAMSVSEPTLFVALELSAREWKLAMTSGFANAPWLRGIKAGDLEALGRVLAAGKRRFALPPTARVVSCYEAGRDGFWIHRALSGAGVANRIVDSASIEVNRRQRRAKTDRIDAIKLVMMLMRVCSGEPGVWREIRVPTAEAEAARHRSRERTQLIAEHTRLRNQIRSWLTTAGCRVPRRRGEHWWRHVRDWAGEVLAAPVQARIARATERLAVVARQITALEAAAEEETRTAAPDSARGRLVQLKGVATTSASVLLEEGLIWREFRNRRQVGGVIGFTPVPFHSGTVARDQGIDRAGNRRWRSVAIQLAWNWVRWQPASALTQWYQARFGRRGARARRLGIVALARKLMIALWRYATSGVVPAGAMRKAA